MVAIAGLFYDCKCKISLFHAAFDLYPVCAADWICSSITYLPGWISRKIRSVEPGFRKIKGAYEQALAVCRSLDGHCDISDCFSGARPLTMEKKACR